MPPPTASGRILVARRFTCPKKAGFLLNGAKHKTLETFPNIGGFVCVKVSYVKGQYMTSESRPKFNAPSFPNSAQSAIRFSSPEYRHDRNIIFIPTVISICKLKGQPLCSVTEWMSMDRDTECFMEAICRCDPV